MRLLILSMYGRMGPSSRVRLFQYLPALKAAGIGVDVRPLLNDAYLQSLYSSGRKRWPLVGARYLLRLVDVIVASSADVVWLEKEVWPWMPRVLDPRLLVGRVPYIADYDDAVFHRYDEASSSLVRRVFSRKIDAVMRASQLVTAGNQYLADRASAAGAPWIEIVPSVVDLHRYPQPVARAGKGFVVGWIGSPSTQHFIEPVLPALRRVLDPATDRFVTIGATLPRPLMVNHEIRAWNEATEAKDIAEFDVGIMPLSDGSFERGKCGFKLIQYMACGRAVIASPVGVNTSLVEQGKNGLLATDELDWERALGRLRQDLGLRAAMGRAGRQLVEERYCVQATAPRVIELITRVAEGQR